LIPLETKHISRHCIWTCNQ